MSDTLEMPKVYEPQQVEQRLYDWWERCGFFQPNEPREAGRAPFVIPLPPPNVTGELHLGHAMYVIEDIMIRWHRMLGDPTLWVPGTDHAGIATQLQVERQLRGEGTSRQQLGREEFLRRTWEWKEKYGGEIQRQLRRMGFSCDWTRERFTLDPGLSRAVRTAFKRLYDDGLIYRGAYLVNWSPNLGTAVSDLEVEHEEREVQMYHVRYPIVGEWTPGAWGSGGWAQGAQEFIVVATTRPETIMGDTAVAVNPEDERYKALIGRQALLPAIGRAIPILADEYADPAFGTGAVKITPAHDVNDYEVGQRHGLPMINIMNKDASLNEQAGPYAGQDRYLARRAVLADLEREGLLVEARPHRMSVGISQRGGEVIEPLLSEQWFVRTKPLAELALAAVRDGETKIVPQHFEKVYFHWMENIEDWCISRQLWWGHRIPVWYTPDGQMIVPGPDDPEPQGEGVYQDPDVLDTWFSSGLWPFSTLGWPDETPDMQRFYPTSVLETGYDILFFWVARMMMMGCYLTGQAPFHTIYLHGLVRDERGRKMSKTAGNVINPLQVMELHGTDALRYTLATSGTPGQDLNLNPQRIEAARNFANKLWNITRFVIGKLGDLPRTPSSIVSASCLAGFDYTLADRWIISGYNRLCLDVMRLMQAHNYGEAGRQILDFLWSEFADWYIETAKVQLDEGGQRAQLTREVLYTVLEGSLRLLHPYMPFVTEELWQFLTQGGSADAASDGARPTIMLAPFPEGDEASLNPQAEADYELLREIVRGVRNIRSEYGVEPGRWIAATIVGGSRSAMLEGQRLVLGRLARIADDQLQMVEAATGAGEQAATLVLGELEIVLPLAGLVDLGAERERLAKELAEAEKDIVRREAKLGNAGFVDRAPAAIVQRERDGLLAAQTTAERLRERIAALG
jgi:valyl-tRNA synthetase